MSYSFFILNKNILDIKAENFNFDVIKLCLVNEIFGVDIKNREILEQQILQSSTLGFVRNSLFSELQSARKPKSKQAVFNRTLSFGDQDIHQDKDGNRVDISALKTMQINLLEAISDCEDENTVDQMLKKEMLACLSKIQISRYEIITDADFLDNRNTTKTGTNIAVDVEFVLDGNEWVVQTWDGFVDDSCQTTIDGNYIELFSTPVSERLLDAVYYACKLVAIDAIKERSNTTL